MKKLPIVVLLGLLALACSCGSDGREASEMPSEDTIPMITQLQACSRLYTTEYQIRTIVTHSDTTQFRGRGLLDGLRVGVPLSSRHIAIPIDATVKGYDATNDVAVLKVEAEGLSAATIGSSGNLSIGDMVVAIGNPLGRLAATETVGYVSGINREVTTDNTVISMLQTDAAINPGNSGGPLFNMYGEVIGITTAKYSGTTNSGASIEGIGFAIPIDDVMGIISDLIDYGYVTGAYMGITVKDNDKEAAAQFGLPTDGAYVVDVTPGSSADKAGIQSKDLITAVDDHKITTRTDLTRTLRNYKAGDTAQVTVVRSGRELTLTITFDEKPHDTTVETTPQEDSSMPSEGDYGDWYEYFRRFFGG